MGHLQLFERAPVASVVRESSVLRTLLVFCINQLDQASFSPLLSILFRQRRSPEGIAGSNWGWTLVPWDITGKNTGVGCHSLLQGSNPGFLPICQELGKLSSGHRTEKGQFSFQFKRKTMPRMFKLPHNYTHLTC